MDENQVEEAVRKDAEDASMEELEAAAAILDRALKEALEERGVLSF